MKGSTWIGVLTLLFGFILLYIVFYCLFFTDVVEKRQYDLEKDGVCLFPQVLSSKQIEHLSQACVEGNYKEAKEHLLQDKRLIGLLKQTLGEAYQFQDYIWIIQKSSVHTCHRDNNGDFFNKGQKYPSYTLLLYLEDMEKCLGVIPTSHKDVNSFNVNPTNKVETLLCKKGDAILFNANLIHVGTIQSKDDHLRIQMKVTHREDIPTLSYYQDFNKVLKKDNTMPKELLQFQKNVSCMFPYVSNLTQSDNIQSARGTDNGEKVGLPQKVFSYWFYGNSDFYDLPNAF
uniref:Phytanoyl-CoA dioxygenase n=1 Tax=viral metagenome TaxID=1070528 RepID=A0A6C0HMC3_9ZZZZ